MTLPPSQLAKSEFFSKLLNFCLLQFAFFLFFTPPPTPEEIRHNSYARSKVSLKLLMPCLRHFKWAICLNISLLFFFWSFPRLIHEPWEGSFVVSCNWFCLPPLNTSMCLHNISFHRAGNSLNLVQMNGPLFWRPFSSCKDLYAEADLRGRGMPHIILDHFTDHPLWKLWWRVA